MTNKFLVILFLLLFCEQTRGNNQYIDPAFTNGNYYYEKSEIYNALIYSLSKTILSEDTLGLPNNKEKRITICEDGLPPHGGYYKPLAKSLPDFDIWYFSFKIENTKYEKKARQLFREGLAVYTAKIKLEGKVLTIEISPKFVFYIDKFYLIDLQKRIYKYEFTLSCDTLLWAPSGFKIIYQNK